ncbi:MAG TPA: NnrS family protein [Polyangia bacterium]|nr:NnrS family protein [Polyangia bacterium]
MFGNATSPRSPDGNILYRPFFLAGILTAVSVGAGWGVWLLWQIGFSGKFTGAPLQQVNAHGHAQVFGWVGFFVMGFGYQMFPALLQRRLQGRPFVPFVLAAMLAGVGLRTLAMATTNAPWAVPTVLIGGALEIAAIATFALQLALTWRASLSRNQPYLRFVAVALTFFLVQAGFCVWHTVRTMTAADHAALIWQVATYQAVLRDLQIHGFVLFIVLGVSIHLLPRFYGTAAVTRRRARTVWGLLLGGVVGEVALFLLFRHTGHHVFAAALLLPWLMLAGGAYAVTAVFKPWAPFPRADRTAKFVRAAYLWLMASFALLLLLPVYQALVHLPFSHAYYGSIRHAVTVGFASQMIMGIAARVVPDLRGVAKSELPPLTGPWVLVNAGCTLRVTLQALTDVHPAFFKVVGVSGVLELTALGWWGAQLIRTMYAARKPAVLPVDAGAGGLASGV